MIWRRLPIVLAVVCLAASAGPGLGWAHPGDGAVGERARAGLASAEREHAEPTDRRVPATRDHAPPIAPLVISGLAMLAGLTRPRRTLALVLVALLTATAFESAAHAVLHLRHIEHANDLAKGASAAQQAATDLDSAGSTANPLAPLGKALERHVALVTETAIAANQGRAPPILPA